MRIDIKGLRIHWFFILPVTLAACASSGDGTNVVVPAAVQMQQPTTPTTQVSRYRVPALNYLQKNADQLRLADPQSELMFVDESVDARNHKHVRFQQVLNGVPVWRRDVIVHLNERDEGYDAASSLLTGLGKIDVMPQVSADAARATAARAKGDGWQSSGSTLTIYMYDMRPRLAYEVTVTRGLERWFVFVDAHDGSVISDMTGMPNQ